MDHLRDELPSQQFNTWIRPLKAESSSEGLTLLAPNRFVQDWVREKFQNRISELINREADTGPVDVFVEVGARQTMAKGAPRSAGLHSGAASTPETLKNHAFS
ncbi:MAG: DnaA N-terminal domain-containing protein, partial [Lentilitoribacter sp.]